LLRGQKETETRGRPTALNFKFARQPVANTRVCPIPLRNFSGWHRRC
jgi:hypothetical protein